MIKIITCDVVVKVSNVYYFIQSAIFKDAVFMTI